MILTSFVYGSYKVILHKIFLVCGLFFILPSMLYAQNGKPVPYMPDQWGSNQTCRDSVNKNIRLTGVSFVAGPHTDRFFTLQPKYSPMLSASQREEKRKTAPLSEYGTFGAVFSYNGATVNSSNTNSSESFMFNKDYVVPFIVYGGRVYRAKKILNSDGESVRDNVLKVKNGPIPGYPRYYDRLLYAYGLAHNHVIGHRVQLPYNPYNRNHIRFFNYWNGPLNFNDPFDIDSAFLLNKGACLVQYYLADPSQIHGYDPAVKSPIAGESRKIKVDRTWIKGYEDSDYRVRFIFLVVNKVDR